METEQDEGLCTSSNEAVAMGNNKDDDDAVLAGWMKFWKWAAGKNVIIGEPNHLGGGAYMVAALDEEEVTQ